MWPKTLLGQAQDIFLRSLVEFMVRRRFNSKSVVIPTYFQRALLRILVNEGHESAHLLEGLRLSLDEFMNDDCRISPSQNIQFIKNALRFSKNPHLGWQFGKQLQITSLGVLGYALMSSENVINAVETLTFFFKIRDPSFELKIVNSPSFADLNVVEIDESYDFEEIRYFMMSCIASAFDHVFTDLTKQKGIISKLELTCEEPRSWGDQVKSIDFPIIFNASKNLIYLDERFLSMEMPAADRDTERSMRQICEELLSSVEDQSGFIKDVKEFIVANIQAYPSLNDVASHLCVSPRTLRRELQRSNTTYQKVLDSIRYSIARKLLLNTIKTTSEVALELGYSDASNFSRAFKSWCGVSPGQFRKSNHQ